MVMETAAPWAAAWAADDDMVAEDRAKLQMKVGFSAAGLFCPRCISQEHCAFHGARRLVDVDSKLGRRQGFELLTLLLQPSACKDAVQSPVALHSFASAGGPLPPPPGVHSCPGAVQQSMPTQTAPAAWWPSDSTLRAVSAAAWSKAGRADSAEWVDDVSTDVSGSDEDSAGLVVDVQSDSSEGRRPDACRAAGWARRGAPLGPAATTHW